MLISFICVPLLKIKIIIKYKLLITTKEICTFSFQNKEDQIEAVFYQGTEEGHDWVSGHVIWAKEGRQFTVETCQRGEEENDCYRWKEMDPKFW